LIKKAPRSILYPTSSDNLLKRATWHVPVDQIALAEQGAAAEVDQINEDSKPTIASRSSSKKIGHKPSSDKVSSGIVKDVALKVIPKKKVKECEANVWGEMKVLKGLDHPNIVRTIVFKIDSTVYNGLIFLSRLNSTNGLNPGQNITSHLNLQLAVNSLREF
jgi:hypothetical protein